MFNSTHSFVALAIARTGTDKWARYATATAVIASNLPDIDSIAAFWGTAAYLDHHRGITHSLIGVPILSALLAGVMYFFSGNFVKTYAVALIAMATHPALDYLNPYGLRPFLPFSNTWYYGDLVFILDPYLDAILLLGIVAGTIMPRLRRVAVWSSLVIALAYVGVRLQLHDTAKSRLDLAGREKVAALPQMLNPFEWEGIVQFRDEIVKFPVCVLDPADLAPPAGSVVRMDRAPSSPVVIKAAATPSAAAVLRFARFPIERVEQTSEGYRVTFTDFRVYRQSTDLAGAKVMLDESLEVVDERLSF
jgi:inner membrane protein